VRKLATFVGVLMVSVALRGESNDSPEALKTAEAQVQSRLEQFSKTNQVDLLLEARTIASSLNPRGDELVLSNLDEDCLRLQLKVLLAIVAARDPHYDRKASTNIVYGNVMPPLMKGNQGFAAGMDPKGIKDAEARKAYEDAIAENHRRNEKLNREMALSREVERALIDIWVFVKRGFPEKSDAKTTALEIIEKTVTDKTLLARLKSDSPPGITW
jgi:hypothetical protein